MNARTLHTDFEPAQQGVLRLITAGSVDDGKSTLIGRLLFDSKGIMADQLEALARTKFRRTEGDALDLALLTDGLEAEREQGITIDVAYRYFSTPRRKFIVADAPGHEQYTRNMVTGASNADVAIILIDATRVRDGQLLTQTKRHSMLAKLLGLSHVVVAVNKMDLLDWNAEAFQGIAGAYAELAGRIGLQAYDILPISALLGDNIVHASTNTPWYAGPPLLSLLESLPASQKPLDQALRFPVQLVARHGGSSLNDFRGYMGEVASGTLSVGEEVKVLASGVTARVRSLYRGLDPVQQVQAGDAITLVLDQDIDISRGDVLLRADDAVTARRDIEADVCWLDSQPLNPLRRYLLKQGTRVTSAKIRQVLSRRDVQDLSDSPASDAVLSMNDIGRIALLSRDPLVPDDYSVLPSTGSFILIDEATHQTAAAGMIRAEA
ncbi:MAG: GTP-binding protein [Pigmentiphaga sp.]